MTRKAENLLKRYETAKAVNWELARKIEGEEKSIEIMATMFRNASKDLMAIERKIKNAWMRNGISLEEYRIITQRA